MDKTETEDVTKEVKGRQSPKNIHKPSMTNVNELLDIDHVDLLFSDSSFASPACIELRCLFTAKKFVLMECSVGYSSSKG